MSFWEVTKFLFDGFLISLLIFGVTLLCGAPLGLPIAFCSMSRIKIVKAVSKVIVWIVRGVPLMLQIFIIYFGIFGMLIDLPGFKLFGFLRFDRFFPGVVALYLCLRRTESWRYSSRVTTAQARCSATSPHARAVARSIP